MASRATRSGLAFVIIALLASIDASAASQAGACAHPPRHRLLYLGPDSVPAGAGVLVGIGPWVAPELGSMRVGRRTPRIELSFHRGSRRVRARIVELAPGLVRAEPERTLAPDAWSVVGVRASHPIRVSSAPASAALDAPRVGSVQRRVSDAHPGAERPSSSVLVAQLGAPAPEGAVAFVVYANDVAVQWSLIGSARSELFVREHPGPCEVWVPETRSPTAGEAVAFAFVDALGRTSPRSSSTNAPR